MNSTTHTLVSTSWLQQHLDAPNLILLDASPAATAEGKQSKHGSNTIAGARHFDLKGRFSDPSSAFPNTLPTAEQFEAECQRLGINQSSSIVVFDNLGIYTSPRVWWMFKVMGHQNVAVLDGGLPAWIEAGFAVANTTVEADQPGNFTATFDPQQVASYEDMVAHAAANNFLVVDARSAGRFAGTAPEPRKQLQSGHIPHSISIPYAEVLHNGRYKSVPELQALFHEKGADGGSPVFSCGSGLTACIVLLAYELSHDNPTRVYDGSWTEWAERQGLHTNAQ